MWRGCVCGVVLVGVTSSFVLGTAPSSAGERVEPASAAAVGRAEAANVPASPGLSTPRTRRPLVFEPNVGQFAPEVAFVARSQGALIELAHDQVRLRLDTPGDGDRSTSVVLRLRVVGGRADRLTGEHRLDTRVSYFRGTSPASWHRDVPAFGAVRYASVRPGVDLVFYGREGALEYDAVVAPGIDLGEVVFELEGATGLALTEAGRLDVETAAGRVEQRLPLVYQERDGERVARPGRFVLRGPARFGFEVEGRDPSLPLVVDPVFTFATFFDGVGGAVATDAAGDVYVLGDTSTGSVPWSSRFGGEAGWTDAFVMKLSPDGSRVHYVTVFGPAWPSDLAVDAAGHVYVTGSTDSPDFPVVNALQPTCAKCFPDPGWGSDTFVTKIDASGTALVYSTYLGGIADERGWAIAVDPAGRAVTTGIVYAPGAAGFPVVNPPSWSRATSSWAMAFLAVLTPDGDQLVRVGLLDAWLGDVAAGPDGRLYVAGEVGPDADVPLVGPVQATRSQNDGFVMQLSPQAASVEFSTIVGGSEVEYLRRVAVAPGGDILVAGLTTSEGLATPGAFQEVKTGRANGFIARLDPVAPAVRYVSYLGGGHEDEIGGLAVDATGRAFVVGATRSVDFPTQPADTDTRRVTATLVSQDGGHQFGAAPIVGSDPVVTCFASARPAPSWYGARVYACSDRGLLESLDGGRSWAFTGFPPVTGVRVVSVAIDPRATNIVYIVTQPGGPLLRSTAFGEHPVPINAPVEPFDRVLVDPFDSDTLYLFNYYGPIFRTRDGGTTWVRLDSTLPVQPLLGVHLVAHPTQPGRLYVANRGRVFTSTTRGDTWYPLSAGLDDAGAFNALAPSPAAPTTMYGLDTRSLYRTTNGGLLWERVAALGFDHLRVLALSHEDPDVLWIGGVDGLFRSDDGGRTLTKLPVVPESAYVSALAANAADPAVVHAGVALASTDAFLTVMSATGDALDYSVRLGAGGSDVFADVAIAPNGAAWVTGWADAVGLPVAGGILQVPVAAGSLYVARFDGPADRDDDGLPTWWEVRAGLDPDVPNAGDDDDGDGLTNLEELARGTHPRGFFTRYLAEGVTGPFFDTRVSVVNADEDATASVQLRFLTEAGTTVSEWLKVPPRTRRAIALDEVAGLADTAVSTMVESDVPVAVDRTVSWDTAGYGAHAGPAVAGPAAAWYFAEGATTPGFELYYLVENPNDVAAAVRVAWLPADGRGELVRDYVVAPQARLTIQANAVSGLEHAEIAAVVTTAASTPVVVERAMYRHAPGQPYAAGHGGAGVTAPATRWYLAEGATGAFFDLFVLVANPSTTDAPLEVQYLLPDGRTIVKSHLVGARQRHTIWVDLEDPALADTAVSTVVTSVAGVPIVVERAMWWPGPTYHTWHGAHAAAGSTTMAPAWALADGETGRGVLVPWGDWARIVGEAETYVLLGNPSTLGGHVRVTLVFDEGATAAQTVWLPPQSRTTVNVLADPWVFSTPSVGERLEAGVRFGVVVEALDPDLAFVVESAVYRNATAGAAVYQSWASGRCAPATPVVFVR